MNLIIDIPEEDYKSIKDMRCLVIVGRNNCKSIQRNVIRAIRNGIPAERPTVILHGQALYITQGHIDAMIEYERKKMEKEFIENFMKGLNNERT